MVRSGCKEKTLTSGEKQIPTKLAFHLGPREALRKAKLVVYVITPQQGSREWAFLSAQDSSKNLTHKTQG